MQPTCVSKVTSLNRFYGTAMGSPVSVTFVYLVMEDVESRMLTSYDIHLLFWKQYVDNTCTFVSTDRVCNI